MEEEDSHLVEIINADDQDSAIPTDASPSANSSSVGDAALLAGLTSTFFMDNVGEVVLTLDPDGLSWKFPDSYYNNVSSCFGVRFGPEVATEIKFTEIYGVELINYGLIHGSNSPNVKKFMSCHGHGDSQMYRFTVHSIQISQNQTCLATYTFGHKDSQICRSWTDRINAFLKLDPKRPKNLLSGKKHGRKTWETVAPIFSRAKVTTKVIVTERAGQAFNLMISMANEELYSYDGIIIVGGDGFFNEVLNGFLLFRLKAPYPPSPSDIVLNDGSKGRVLCHDKCEAIAGAPEVEDYSPLLSYSNLKVMGFEKSSMPFCSFSADRDSQFLFPQEDLRLGVIPAGSTDAIVMCTTGTRDPITSALQIVMGKRISLDIAQIVRWKTTFKADVDPCVRYAASFAGYGFYGDVITESEKYRWMGPKRYDYAGTKVFLRHRSYEAEVAYFEAESAKTESSVEERSDRCCWMKGMCGSEKPERKICRMNCGVCCSPSAAQASTSRHHAVPYSLTEGGRWMRRTGRFLSVGAAIMSNRNEKAPDGLVAEAHLSDGFLHLLLIKDCPRPLYLWHLTQLAKKGGEPLSFNFVEHHKTSAFTFTSIGKESVWNLDGELFPAHELSAQVFRGLISLFASGPSV
ncbi:Ceramide kinase [Linum perenne]